ncbi:hypothetical protein [Microbispora triticiradicis]|uniref:hypothetical protein n=1 Tax=Microbispora triticiradicis TaxID=2200763 RepID=UPI001AD77DAF|nr:hypothetical protein [Microbispora triticiradicis]MBO4269307.1 hypothetical protein [Microbispora triticiradicis]
MGEAQKKGWYAVRCIFRWGKPYDTYEERITLWRAGSAEDAILLAEREAEEYVDGTSFEYLGLAQSYHLGEETPAHGTEVFSLLRDSDLEPDEYLDTFFDTGSEHQGKIGEGGTTDVADA